MAIQTRSLVGDGAKGHHRFTLYVTEEWYDIATNKSYITWRLVLSPISNGWDWYYSGQVPVTYIVRVAGNRYDGKVMNYNGLDTLEIGNGSLYVVHDPDGTKKNIDLSIDVWSLDIYYLPGSVNVSETMDLTPIPRKATIISAPNFTDEDSPVVTFSNPAGNTVEYLEIGIYDTNGVKEYVPYRKVDDISATSFKIDLTEEDKNRFYEATKESKEPLAVNFYIATKIGDYLDTHYVTKTISIANANPVIDTVDVNAIGRRKVIISGCNYTEFTFTAHAVKGAYISSRTVMCGSEVAIIDENGHGALENVESGEFIFSVTDAFCTSTLVSRKLYPASLIVQYSSSSSSLPYSL